VRSFAVGAALILGLVVVAVAAVVLLGACLPVQVPA
jgi:hypothetical protein